MTKRKKNDILLGGRTSGLDGTYLNNNKQDLMDLTNPILKKQMTFLLAMNMFLMLNEMRRMSTKDVGYPLQREILPQSPIGNRQHSAENDQRWTHWPPG